jgi:Sugar (pentulose and hexulose) kinases
MRELIQFQYAMKEVIAVFDIGKTNKKILLFDTSLKLVFQEESRFDEITDDDGFPCDDIEQIEHWILHTTESILNNHAYKVKAINFATYGASLIYLDEQGKRLTPLYNYLKPMPYGVLNSFYDKYGGVEEFSRNTASPALGMLNSGLQILWLKRTKPEVFNRVRKILHFPQYLSYLLTGKINADYTSIGCHTALWDFDKNEYHRWLAYEGITLPSPISNGFVFPYNLNFENQQIPVGIGIHDSSSSLVPYLEADTGKFILISTGTWCISMNPFNAEPLTMDQLKRDTLCYMSTHEKQVKSSRLFLGYIHEVNLKRISEQFNVSPEAYKLVSPEVNLMGKSSNVFFKTGIPDDYLDEKATLKDFESFEHAYHQFMLDLCRLTIDSIKLIIPANDDTRKIYISGGFAHNNLFTRTIATLLSGKEVYTSEVDNATALGAAMVLKPVLKGLQTKSINLGLKRVEPFTGLTLA